MKGSVHWKVKGLLKKINGFTKLAKLTPSSDKVKNTWSYTSTPLKVCKAWLLVHHRDSLIPGHRHDLHFLKETSWNRSNMMFYYKHYFWINHVYVQTCLDLQHVPLKRRSTIILHGSTSHKTILNFILAAVRTLNLTRLRCPIFRSMLVSFNSYLYAPSIPGHQLCFPVHGRKSFWKHKLQSTFSPSRFRCFWVTSGRSVILSHFRNAGKYTFCSRWKQGWWGGLEGNVSEYRVTWENSGQNAFETQAELVRKKWCNCEKYEAILHCILVAQRRLVLGVLCPRHGVILNPFSNRTPKNYKRWRLGSELKL
jgi:hypothetical protein